MAKDDRLPLNLSRGFSGGIHLDRQGAATLICTVASRRVGGNRRSEVITPGRPDDPDLPEELRASLTDEELEQARAALAAAGAAQAGMPTGPVPLLDRGEYGKPIEERAYLPRDAAISLAQSRLGGPFEIIDPGWATSAFAMAWRLARQRRKFPERPAEPVELADDARILVVGEWASGHHRARMVSAEMRRWLEEGDRQGRQQHVDPSR